MNRLAGKVAIITGGNSGVGAATAIKFASEGAKVVITARREAPLLEVAEKIRQAGGEVLPVVSDISKAEDAKRVLDATLEAFGKVDILINNAGFMLKFATFDKYSDDEIVEIVNTNFFSVVNSTKVLLPLLKQSKTPAIINIASSAGLCAVVGQSMYCATKHAVKGFTETLIQDYKKQIYVCGVYPGFIKTDIFNRQQVDTKDNKLINKVMMPVSKAAKKVVRNISKGKKRVVMGFDGRYMGLSGRLFPQTTPSLIRGVLKASKQELFKDVFEQ